MVHSVCAYRLPFYCGHAVVNLETKNQGDDAFKADVYGDVIIIERRISETTSSTDLKDHQGFPSF